MPNRRGLVHQAAIRPAAGRDTAPDTTPAWSNAFIRGDAIRGLPPGGHDLRGMTVVAMTRVAMIQVAMIQVA